MVDKVACFGILMMLALILAQAQAQAKAKAGLWWVPIGCTLLALMNWH
jgi:hypothetical protein